MEMNNESIWAGDDRSGTLRWNDDVDVDGTNPNPPKCKVTFCVSIESMQLAIDTNESEQKQNRDAIFPVLIATIENIYIIFRIQWNEMEINSTRGRHTVQETQTDGKRRVDWMYSGLFLNQRMVAVELGRNVVSFLKWILNFVLRILLMNFPLFLVLRFFIIFTICFSKRLYDKIPYFVADTVPPIRWEKNSF